MKNSIKIEGIAESLDDVKLINDSKSIDRIELVRDLSKGGLTPEIDTIKKAKEITSIPIFVMIRPHDKGFVYSKKEIDEIKLTIEKIKKFKIDGIVFGSLTKNGEIDQEQLKEIIEFSKPMKLTFHRAVDKAKDYLNSIEILNNYEIENILTSGSEENALKGIENIKKAIEISKHNIMPGSGIEISNIEYFKNLDIKYLHFGTALKHNGIISNSKIMEIKNLVK